MTCACCQASRETNGHYNYFNNRGCLCCSARIIQKIQRLPIAKSDVSRRCKAMLDESVAAGFSEEKIRALAKSSDMAVEPLEIKGGKK